jgi:hypothetical protein
MSGIYAYSVLKVSFRQLNYYGIEFVVWFCVNDNLNMKTVANILEQESIQKNATTRMGYIGRK